MANLIVTNNDLGTVILKDAVHDDIIFQFPGTAIHVEGTILARKQVEDLIVAVVGEATGNGTVTLVAPIAGDVVPLVGVYNLEVVTAVVNGGIWKLEDPNGSLIDGNLAMTVGAGIETLFTAGGMTFTITDGTTDFAVTDSFTLTVVADGDVVIFDEDGIGGAQIPLMVLTYEVESTEESGEDQAQRALVSGQVRREKLVIDAGGTVTDLIVDKLRDFGIIAKFVDELNIQDNQ